MKRNTLCWSLSALILLAGCGSGSEGPTVPPPPSGADAGSAATKPAPAEKGAKGGMTKKGATANIND